jgi:hypothetical protein
MTTDEMELHIKEIFVSLDCAANKERRGFAPGFMMQEAAYKVAPKWLQKWDDDNRWVICLTNGWERLVIMARAFGWSKEKLLNSLISYKNEFEN